LQEAQRAAKAAAIWGAPPRAPERPAQLHALPLEALQRPGPRKAGHVRFVCISDTHNQHGAPALAQLPPGDVLVCTGDFTSRGTYQEVEAFCRWFGAQPHPRKLLIAGNHDVALDASAPLNDFFRAASAQGGAERAPLTAAVLALVTSIPGCDYLCDSGTSVDGLRVWGSPWQPGKHDGQLGGFNLQRNGPKLRGKWRLIPPSTDVLLTHGPPLGCHDVVDRDGSHAGCHDLACAVASVRPSLHVFGHIHEGYGASTDGTTTFVNASSCNRQRLCGNPPLVIDVPARAASAEEGAE